MELDREMLATDLAGVLSENHDIDVDSDDVKRGLDAFLEAIKPTKLSDATRRVGAFLELYAPHKVDEIAALDDQRLLMSDVRALLRAVRVNQDTRSLREKLTKGGGLPAAMPNGVTLISCPLCDGRTTVFEGIIQRHLKPSGLPCTSAGLDYQAPGATDE